MASTDPEVEVQVQDEPSPEAPEAEPQVPEQPKTREEEEGATIDRNVRLSGEVTKYMSRQGFGFINMDDSSSEEDERLFFHWKAIVSDERWPKVSEGTRVEFYLGTQQDGRKFASHVTGPNEENLNLKKKDLADKPRHTGHVKFFDKKKGFGFVETKEEIEEHGLKKGDELFVGREEICSDDNPPVLRNGMVVEFYACRTEKGIACAEVSGIGGEKISIPRDDNYNNNRGGNNRNRYHNNNNPFFGSWNYPSMQLRYRGTVQTFNQEKGYGWIMPERQILGNRRAWRGSGRSRIYFHVNDLEEDKRDDLEGQEVTFITYNDRQGTGAARIQFAAEEPEVEPEIPPVDEEEQLENSIPNAPTPPQVPPVMHPYDTVPSLITLQVQNIFVGGLIGKQGKSIRELNRTSGCMIQVLDVEDDEPLTPHSTRVVSISGCADNVKKACKLITKKLAEISKNALGRIEFLFDAELTGRIIGKRGANISRLRQKTHPDSPLYVTVSKEGLEFRGKQMNSLEIFGPIKDVSKVLERAVDLLVDLQHQTYQEEYTQMDNYNPYAYGYGNQGQNMEYMTQFQQPQYNQKPAQPMSYYNVGPHHGGHQHQNHTNYV